MDEARVLERIRAASQELDTLGRRLQKTWAPALKSFAAVGQAVDRGLQQPLAAAQKTVAGVQKALDSLHGTPATQTVDSLGGSVRSASAAMRQLGVAATHLQAGFAQMAAPIAAAAVPALSALTEGLATVLAYAGRLFSFLGGKAVKGAQGAAAAVTQVGKAAAGTAKRTAAATRSLADFDEILRLEAPKAAGGSASAGGSAGKAGDTAAPWQAKSPFLDQLLAAVQQGEYGRVGALLGEKLTQALQSIPWDGIRAAARHWALHLTALLNGFMAAPDVWAALGMTLGSGLDSALLFLSTGLQTFDWAGFGTGLARFLNNAVRAVSWDEAGKGISALVIGLMTALKDFLLETDWKQIGDSIGTLLANIDWPGVLHAAAALIGAAIQSLLELDMPIALLGTLAAALAGVGQAAGAWQALQAAGKGVLDLLLNGLNPAVGLAAAAVAALVAAGILLYQNWDAICAGARAVWAAIQEAWGGVCAWFDTTVVQPLWQLWQGFGSALQALAENGPAVFRLAWGAVAAWVDTAVIQPLLGLWNGLTGTLGAVWAGAVARFTGAWAGLSGWFSTNIITPLLALWQAFSGTVTGIWAGITGNIRGAVNGIIGVINRLIDGLTGAVNAIAGALNGLHIEVPAWVPRYGGARLGFHLPTVSLPHIPYLAQGAVIPANREFLAVLGDQSAGTNVEAPLATIEQAVANVLDSQLDAMMAGFEAVVAAIQNKETGVYIGDEAIGRAAARYQSRRQLITGGVL